MITPDAYGQLLTNDDDDYVILRSPPVNVAGPSHTQGSSAPIIEPGSDIPLMDRSDLVASPLGALGIRIASDILVRSSDETQPPSTLANANALNATEDGDDSEDEVVYDDTHSTLIEDMLSLRISVLNARQPSNTPSDATSESTGYETASSEDSSPPIIPSVGARTLTKSQRRREQRKRAKLRAQEAEIAQEQGIEPTNVTMAPKGLTKSQKRSARRRRARARKQISNQHEMQKRVPSLTPPQRQSKASVRRSKKAKTASMTEQGLPKGWNFVKSDFYLNAVQYMTNYLASARRGPHVPNTGARLALSQALLIETGAVNHPSALPSTHKQAKLLLKSVVHINVLDYLRVRDRGLKAIQGVLFKSRAALMRDLRKGKHASLETVKRYGLNDFLVDVYD